MSCDLSQFKFTDKLFKDLPGWKCVKNLGNGTYGQTYLIKKGKLKMVIKAIYQKYTHSAQVMNEANVLKKLHTSCSKKHVLCHTGVFEYDDSVDKGVFIVTEYIDGYDMFDYYYTHLDKKNAERLTYSFILQAIESLNYIHNLKVAHLDIKPENIMISKKGDLKLIDFGGAGYFGKNCKVEQHTLTTQYLPPDVVGNMVTLKTGAFRDFYAMLRSFRHEGERIISPLDILGTIGINTSKFMKLYGLFDVKDFTIKTYKKRINQIVKLLNSA
jgi:serine/threonine protein kinase